MRSPLTKGNVVAGFRVGSQIGAGAMGTVYLAEEEETGKQVALKLRDQETLEETRCRGAEPSFSRPHSWSPDACVSNGANPKPMSSTYGAEGRPGLPCVYSDRRTR